jgi:hypothetical protein
VLIAFSRRGVAEIAIEVDFREQQRQVLEVLPDDRLLAARDPALVEPLRVLDDVLVVLQQQLGRQLRQIEQLGGERVMEAMDVVLVQPLPAPRRAGARPIPRIV